MEIIVVGSGVIGITTTHSLLKQGYKVTLIDEASSPCQGSSFADERLHGGAIGKYVMCSFQRESRAWPLFLQNT